MAVIVREKLKGSGEWWVFINHKGKRRSKKVGTKKAANAVRREVEARLARGDMGMVKERCPTLSSYGKEVLNSPLNDWAYRTGKEYRLAFKLHIKPCVGSMRVDEIKRRNVKKMIVGLKEKGLSSARIRTIIYVLSTIFNHAIEDEYVEVNPSINWGKQIGNGKVREINPLTVAEAHEFVEASKRLTVELHALFMIALKSGLRFGEMLALSWDDINLESRTLDVNKTWDDRNKRFGATKGKEKRVVRLTPATATALEKFGKDNGKLGLLFPNKRDSEEPRNPQMIRRWLEKIPPKRMTFHDLRHFEA
jgi:integrase